ncbi:putative uncharacterized protein [Waddlia chondrophila 2032/99]|uniref:Uncharacterized protein n=2 Tax=Waddlia chondrophila TaxID=71667 RepID=D6YS76_WADCW|nr:hypothetical protein [Waddlia chondrophila]ADI38921.1 hypothetical protein wcw_1573 [Waddlia chondrophila WSU 86-1044]CCB92039.1 putative uncharacterized protein [Waddlia chondrophila 2032/99]
MSNLFSNNKRYNNEKWHPVDSFKGYHIGGSYTEKGKEASSDYEGRRYTIVEIRVRNFSGLERFGRGLLGVAAVICSLGLALFSESVRNLFISSEKGICFAEEIKEKNASEENETEDSSSSNLEGKKEADESKVGEGKGINAEETSNSSGLDLTDSMFPLNFASD